MFKRLLGSPKGVEFIAALNYAYGVATRDPLYLLARDAKKVLEAHPDAKYDKATKLGAAVGIMNPTEGLYIERSDISNVNPRWTFIRVRPKGRNYRVIVSQLYHEARNDVGQIKYEGDFSKEKLPEILNIAMDMLTTPRNDFTSINLTALSEISKNTQVSPDSPDAPPMA